MDEIKYVVKDRDSGGWGAGAAAVAAVGFLAVGGLALWAGNRNRGGDCGCCPDPYLLGENNGQVKAGIACNAQSIARVENAISQMQQNQFYAATTAAATASVINSQNVNQQKTDAGLAVLANQNAVINSTLNSALGNRFVWCKPICETSTATAAA